MPQVVKLPKLVGWASASDSILIDENLDGPEVPGEVAGILVGLGQFGRRDLRVVAR